MTDWITQMIEQMGYVGIALLMFLENLFPPLPSEVIMPMAGFTASKGTLGLTRVLVAGTGGTLAGACFWYAVARVVGNERLKKWAYHHGRWITLQPQQIDELKARFEHHSNWAVPLGHLVPGVRTLISIPAGIFHMSISRFIFLTALGAGLWTTALGVAGYILGTKFDAIERYLGPASTLIMVSILIVYIYRVSTFRKS
ncbi:DedA family protein [Novosphingobium sp. HR1a]|nr:DedA family protein [Novosphingobium sp. HR1a]